MFLYRRQLDELEKKYQHVLAFFGSHVKDMVERLSVIANRNILYGATHEEFEDRFIKIHDQYENSIALALGSLSKMKDNKNNKGFMTLYPSTKTMIANYDRAVADIARDLEKIMKPEEDTRNLSYGLKEEIRKIKDEHRHHQNELALIERSFDVLFNNVDGQLKKLDDLIEIADYAEANNLVAKLRRLSRQVDEVIREAPALCVMIERVIPEKIKALRDEADRMVKRQYPIHHLLINGTLDKIGDDLIALTSQLTNMQIAGINERIVAHMNKIESFYGLFEQEKEAKEKFLQEYDKTEQHVNAIERQFMKLNATLPKIREYYVIGAAQLQNIETIRASVSNLNLTKRALDTLVLASTKQPYTLQVAKIDVLKTEHDQASRMITDFSAYLAGLKTDSEQAYRLVDEYYNKFKQAERLVNELDIDNFTNTVIPEFERYYESLLLISQTLKVLPIDMETISKHVTSLKTDGEALLSRIDQEINVALRAEGAIIHGNRHRHRLSDYHRQLTISENAYFQGEFQKSYIDAGNLLKKISEQLAHK